MIFKSGKVEGDNVKVVSEMLGHAAEPIGNLRSLSVHVKLRRVRRKIVVGLG